MHIVLPLITLIVTVVTLPHDLIKFSISSYILPDKTLSMELDVVAPRSPQKYPAILYMTGLAGLLPSYFQSTLIDGVAQEGFVFITVSKIQSPNPEKVTHTLNQVVAWINANFQDALSNRAPGVVADIANRFVLMGHSAAGHVTTQFLYSNCGDFKMHILLDPVDGVDPFGIKKDYIITPGKLLPYATPVLVLMTELDPKSKVAEPPCAPTNLSNQRFYNAMSGPKWFLNVSKYGHADFLNLQYRDVAGLVCATCSKNCDYAQYRNLVKNTILSFYDGIINKNATSISNIEAAKFSIPTTVKFNHMGFDIAKGGFCIRTSNYNREQSLITHME